MFSIGFKSGQEAGHFINFILFFIYKQRESFDLCFESLSHCKIHPFDKIEFISSKELSIISMYFAESIFPSKNFSLTTPLLQNTLHA